MSLEPDPIRPVPEETVQRRAGRIPQGQPSPQAARRARHDSLMLGPLLDAVPPVRQCAGQPRKRPASSTPTRPTTTERCRRACRKRGIVPQIARRGIESGERLGRHRRVVERTLAWFARYPPAGGPLRAAGRHVHRIPQPRCCPDLPSLRRPLALPGCLSLCWRAQATLGPREAAPLRRLQRLIGLSMPFRPFQEGRLVRSKSVGLLGSVFKPRRHRVERQSS